MATKKAVDDSVTSNDSVNSEVLEDALREWQQLSRIVTVLNRYADSEVIDNVDDSGELVPTISLALSYLKGKQQAVFMTVLKNCDETAQNLLKSMISV